MHVERCWSYMDGSHIIYAMIRTGTIVIGMAAYANSCHIGCVSWIHPEEVASLIPLQHHWTMLLRWFDTKCQFITSGLPRTRHQFWVVGNLLRPHPALTRTISNVLTTMRPFSRLAVYITA